jgi:hypothetical protein
MPTLEQRLMTLQSAASRFDNPWIESELQRAEVLLERLQYLDALQTRWHSGEDYGVYPIGQFTQ